MTMDKSVENSENRDEDVEDDLILCPSVSTMSGTTSLCWTCSIMCCCFPFCYPCYLSKTMRKRSKRKTLPSYREANQEGHKRSDPWKATNARVTTTMSSQQSTGTSGYGTLLSRKGTLVSLQPNMKKWQIQKALLGSQIENKTRRNISALFVATEASASFLSYWESSELLQGLSVQKNYNFLPREVNDIPVPAQIDHEVDVKCSSSRSNLSSDSSYSFSQLCLHLDEEASRDLGTSSKMSRFSVNIKSDKKDNQGRMNYKDNEGIHYDFDKEGLFRGTGHVDVSEDTVPARIFTALEVYREDTRYLDPVQLANTFCRQLAKTDLVVVMVTEKDRAKFERKGLLDYVSKYWSGFFKVLLVDIGRNVHEGDMLLHTLGQSFGCVKVLGVEDGSNIAGKVFSTVARIGIESGLKIGNNIG